MSTIKQLKGIGRLIGKYFKRGFSELAKRLKALDNGQRRRLGETAISGVVAIWLIENIVLPLPKLHAGELPSSSPELMLHMLALIGAVSTMLVGPMMLEIYVVKPFQFTRNGIAKLRERIRSRDRNVNSP